MDGRAHRQAARLSKGPARRRHARRNGGGEGTELPVIWQLVGDAGLPQRLLLLAKMIERVTSKQLQAEFQVSVAQWRVLAFVCISGPATASFIGEAAEVDPAEVSRAVKALVTGGFVSRAFEPGSRKTMVIAPSATGRALFARIRRQRQAYFSRITRDLSPSDKADLNRCLTIMAEAVVNERAAS